jgi:hypothetical protein
VVTVATPPLSNTVLSPFDPSLKVTLPVGICPLDVTVAVKVTAWPRLDGFKDELRAVNVLTPAVPNRTLRAPVEQSWSLKHLLPIITFRFAVSVYICYRN